MSEPNGFRVSIDVGDNTARAGDTKQFEMLTVQDACLGGGAVASGEGGNDAGVGPPH